MGSRSDVSSVLGHRVAKAFLVDLTTGEAMEFLFNPAELEEVLSVKWNFFASIGGSHARPQFQYTENVRWTFTAFYDQLFYEFGKPRRPSNDSAGSTPTRSDSPLGAAGPTEVEDWRNFIFSIGTPRRVTTGGANRIASASPTPLHFEWPGLVSTTIRLEKAKLKHTLFQVGTARARVYSVDFEVFEDPAERMYADDVRKHGTIRSWAASSTPRR